MHKVNFLLYGSLGFKTQIRYPFSAHYKNNVLDRQYNME